MNQSTAQRRATSLVGRLADCNTISMVTRPADGIAAAPTAAAIDVNLNDGKKLTETTYQRPFAYSKHSFIKQRRNAKQMH